MTNESDAMSPQNPSFDALGDVQDASGESTVEVGGQLIEAMGNDLAAAASGHLKDVDMDNARLRLRDVQTALVSLGYSLDDNEDDVEHIESGDSRALSETVRVFQDENDLEVSGRIDRETYEAIMSHFEQALGVVDPGGEQDDFHLLQTDDGEATGDGLTEQAMAQADDLLEDAQGLDGDDQAGLNPEQDTDADLERFLD